MRKLSFIAAATLLVCSATSHASFSSVSAGYSSQQAMGNNYQTLGRADGFQASTTYEAPQLLPEGLRFRATFNYHAHKVKNLTDSKINFIGTYAGFELANARNARALQPTLGAELGLVYDSLSLAGGSTVSNSALLFGTRIVPGIRSSFFGMSNLLWGAEFPISWTFSKNSFTTWSAVVTLGWAL